MAMSEDDRDDIFDMLKITEMVIWEGDEELGHFAHANLKWWMDECLRHPHADGHGYCHTCGPATTCMAGAFTDSLASSVIRRLDELGLLRTPAELEPVVDQEKYFFTVDIPEEAEVLPVPGTEDMMVPKRAAVTVTTYKNRPLTVRMELGGPAVQADGSEGVWTHLRPPAWGKKDWPHWVALFVRAKVKEVRGE